MVVAHGPYNNDSRPDLLKKIDAVDINGYSFPLHVEDTLNPQNLDSITLYSSEGIQGMESISIDEGVEAIKQFVQEIPEKRLE